MRPLEPPEEIKRMAETGEVGVKTVPATEVAFLVHKGPHSGLQDSFLKLMRWVAENGYELMGPGEAVFHNDPVTVRSEEELITELRFPVRKK
ncbi:GyrI-like domain-containing protein [Candidatus Solincola tengchongensis]|uniref:GyrI-like domain-containing protein n=1 Tax=Candidatus Solincola tengchongensis TaxID=2900693 RepID=UPI00257ECFA6|nr:GyrI-like domain-containing protein [Candidatus Solincola tengchongensis]